MILQALAPESAAGLVTVLLVEDEEFVRRLVAELLRREGYQVIAAARPSEALVAASSHRGEIHVLLTDVVMPEMRGPQLATRVRELRPGLQVLYMSGYNDFDLPDHDGPEPPAFVGKPFSPQDLAQALRSLLHR